MPDETAPPPVLAATFVLTATGEVTTPEPTDDDPEGD
jgi:hypothetical protein